MTAGLLGHWGFGPRGVDSLQERVARGSRRLRFENSLEDSQASPPHQTWPVMQPYPLAAPPANPALCLPEAKEGTSARSSHWLYPDDVQIL